MNDLNLNINDRILYLAEMRYKDKSEKLKKLSQDTDMIWIHEWNSIFKSSNRKEKLKKIFNI